MDLQSSTQQTGIGTPRIWMLFQHTFHLEGSKSLCVTEVPTWTFMACPMECDRKLGLSPTASSPHLSASSIYFSMWRGEPSCRIKNEPGWFHAGKYVPLSQLLMHLKTFVFSTAPVPFRRAEETVSARHRADNSPS